jgi:hypothetical protein
MTNLLNVIQIVRLSALVGISLAMEIIAKLANANFKSKI